MSQTQSVIIANQRAFHECLWVLMDFTYVTLLNSLNLEKHNSFKSLSMVNMAQQLSQTHDFNMFIRIIINM